MAWFAALLLSLLGACGDDSGSDDADNSDGGRGSRDANVDGPDGGRPKPKPDGGTGQPGTDGGNPAADGGNPAADGGNPAADGGNPTADGGQPGPDAGMGGLAEGGDCPDPEGAGTEHSADIAGDEVWTEEDSPHFITSTLTVKGTLTIEDCALVVLAEGVSLNVGSSTDEGRLITEGIFVEETATEPQVLRPVIFTSAADDEYWGMLFVNGLGRAEFNATALIQGGDASAVSTSRGGSLVARGPNDGTLSRMITANGLVVLDSGSFGITLESGAGFVEDAAASVLVRGTGLLPRPAGYGASFDPVYPVFVEPPGVGSLPPGTYYGSSSNTFEANDKILVVPRNAITVDEQFHERSVPYLIQGDFYMRPATTATLTIDPGVELRFFVDPEGSTKGRMTLGDGASADPRPVKLDIQGTEEQPIVFTSDAEEPAAGDWVGLYLDYSPSTGNALTYAQVLYAGADSQTASYGCGPTDNDAAIMITDWRPDEPFIQEVEIFASAGGGIMCGWSSDEEGPDLGTGNSFGEIGNGCDLSRWRNATGEACPGRTDEAPLCY